MLTISIFSIRINPLETSQSSSLKPSKLACAECKLYRRACNLSGKLGSLYNARTDRFVQHNPPIQKVDYYDMNPVQISKWWWFDEKKGITDLLDTLEIENELCLSVYVGMGGVERNGRTSVINYEKPFNSRTLFLLYSCDTSKQSLPPDSGFASNLFSDRTFNKLNVDATHVVYEIVRGIEALFVIDVPKTIDGMDFDIYIASLLDKICNILTQNTSMPINLTQDEQDIWKKLNVTIKASSPRLRIDQSNDVKSIIRCIQQFRDSWPKYEHPLVYTFQPVEWIYNTIAVTTCNYFQNNHPQESKKIQQQLYLLQNALSTLSAIVQFLRKDDQNQQLLRQSIDIDRKLQSLQKLRDELLRNLRSTLHDVRLCTKSFHMLSEILKEPKYISLYHQNIDPIIKECYDLCNKVCLIGQLTSQNFQYQQIQNDDSSSKKEQIIKLFGNSSQSVYILCSSDTLIKRNPELWNSCQQELIKKKNDDSTVRLIFADLSYCKHEDIKETTIISLDYRTPKSISLSSKQVIEKTDINVLLLGESGVGKSTFINAFVNYLTFDSLEQAAAGKPVVLIPVSFLLTFNHNFQDFVVKFGDTDRNEDHDHPGQSVTQDCRSYVFDINDKFRLRLIDTPGIGDTRGLEQDDINIDKILSYINNLPHINAICILLQPNITRLSVVFRSCIAQLFTYLTPAARDNIIFCFTNTRLTFFAPGNTVPALKSFLKELPISDIPFIKKNSFCFDSESFRYLAAVKNKFPFDDNQLQNFNDSWAASVMESERLIKFICRSTPYYISQRQSVRHAKLEIYMIIRPLMESFRKLIFNFILQQSDCEELYIKVIPKPIAVPCAICYHGQCSLKTIRCGTLVIISYPIHPINTLKKNQNGSLVSSKCTLRNCTIVDYELKYETSERTELTTPIKYHELNRWLDLCLDFACFIHSDSPFISYFDQFISEEQLIISKEPEDKYNHEGNIRMEAELIKLKKYFKEKLEVKITERKPDITQIYQHITELMSIPDIKAQVDATKQSRLTILKSKERYIPRPSHSTGILYRITEQSSN